MDAASLAALALRPRAPELRRQWQTVICPKKDKTGFWGN
jgi:hypothetical protein